MSFRCSKMSREASAVRFGCCSRPLGFFFLLRAPMWQIFFSCAELVAFASWLFVLHWVLRAPASFGSSSWKAAGLFFAHLGLRSLLALVPQNAPLPRSEPIAIDARVLLFTFLASLFTAVVFGLVPALRLSRVDLQNALKQGTLRGGVGGHQTLRRSFVVAEVALALLLSVGAGLMLRSFAGLISVDPGFSPEHLLTMHIWTSPARYHDNLKRSQYFDRVLAEIRGTPGVQAAGSTHFLPLTERISGSCFSYADQPAPSPADSPSAQFLIISSGYFQTMGTALIRGRDFDHRDRFNSLPVAIVNHAFVDRYYSGQNALGKQLRVCWDIEKPVEIVGVVADARQAQLQDAPNPPSFSPTRRRRCISPRSSYAPPAIQSRLRGPPRKPSIVSIPIRQFQTFRLWKPYSPIPFPVLVFRPFYCWYSRDLRLLWR
ncbi:hypothetical protein E6H17_08465 [Candidatus Bathyarchaeota archaeon]|nr:MAG: hypothetical protein E6H17_08465 [Candidatus Bathyarchaeota archaeon]